MINRFFLRLFLAPTMLYKRYGINQHHLRSIVLAKLTIDDRVPSVFYNKKNTNLKLSTLVTMAGSLVMGLFFLISFLFEDDITRLTFYFSFYAFVLSATMIIDFAHVMVDVRDNYIILPKPLTPSTFVASRLIYMMIHMMKIVIPMTLPGIIAMTVTRGYWGGFVFLLDAILITLFIVFVVNVIYMVLIRFFSPERFNSIIGTIQIIFSIVLFASGQILNRGFEEIIVEEINISRIAAFWLYPPYWFAHAWKLLYTGQPELSLIAGGVVSGIMTIVGVFLIVRYFAPMFQQKLALIGTNVTESKATSQKQSKVRGGVSAFFARLMTRPGPERASFLFTWKMMGRRREFKMKYYPQIGYMFVFVVLITIKHIKSYLSTGTVDIDTSMAVLSMIYLVCFLISTAIFLVPVTENFKAAWIFFTAPQKTPGELVLGGAKACIGKFGVPAAILVALISILIKGAIAIPNLLFGFGNVLLLCAAVTLITMKNIPFSVPIREEGGLNLTRAVLIMLFLGILSIPHYFMFDYPLITGLASLISISVALVILKSIRNTSWKELEE